MHTWVDPRVKLVRVGQAVAYMTKHKWVRRPYPRPQVLVFQGPLDDAGQPIELVVPSSDDLEGADRAYVSLITTLGVLERRHPVDVLNDMLRESAATPVPAVNGVATAEPPARPRKGARKSAAARRGD